MTCVSHDISTTIIFCVKIVKIASKFFLFRQSFLFKEDKVIVFEDGCKEFLSFHKIFCSTDFLMIYISLYTFYCYKI